MANIASPVPLTASHKLQSFKNGVYPELDEWLARHALSAQRSGSARTFVVCERNCVVGYFALTLKSIKTHTRGERITRGMPAYEIPCILLARLAVHEQYQNRGLGRSLIIDVLQRVLAVAEEVGTRALLVDAIDQRAAKFYDYFGFVQLGDDPLTRYMLIKDIRKTVSEIKPI